MPAEAWEAAPAGQIYPEVQHCGAVEDGYTDGLTMQLVSFSDIDKVFPLPATRLSHGLPYASSAGAYSPPKAWTDSGRVLADV